MHKTLIAITLASIVIAVGAVLVAVGVVPMGATNEGGAGNGNAQIVAHEGAGLGRVATEAEVALLNISIRPDGVGLPPGQGTVQEGALIFGPRCANCHGPRGRGGQGGRLSGGVGTLGGEEPIKTVNSYWPYATTLFDYIRRAMPLYEPQSLTDSEVYALVAYILMQDRIIEPTDVMNATTLPQVIMPNRNGFVEWWPRPPE
jgi:S-disulfanyl-L-cysteine oxidoreductase SoxD